MESIIEFGLFTATFSIPFIIMTILSIAVSMLDANDKRKNNK